MTKNNKKTTTITSILASFVAVSIIMLTPNGISAESVPAELTTQEQLLVPSTVKSYEVKSLDSSSLRADITKGIDMSIDFKGKTYDLYLIEHDLRGSDAVAGIHTAEGLKEVPLEDISTYRGYVKGDPNSDVFLAVSDSMVGGFISLENDEIAIESLNQRTKDITTDKQIMYSIKDLDLEGLNIDSEEEHNEQSEETQPKPVSWSIEENSFIPVANAVGPSWTADIILDCDREFYDEYASWQGQQLLVLGGVDLAFDDADDGDFSAAGQFCDTGHNDYTEDTAGELTDQLRDYWDGLSNSRDLVVLYSGQDLYDVNRDLGQAEAIDGLQNTATQAYASFQTVNAVDTNKFSGSLLEQKILMAHEVGHLFDCRHSDASNNSIMTNPWSGSMVLDFSSACASKISASADEAGLP